MPIPKRELQRAIAGKLGFVPTAGSRHEAHSLIIGGEKVATTRFSRGGKIKEIGDQLLRQIALQMKMKPGNAVARLYEIVSCSRSRQDYLKELCSGGHFSEKVKAELLSGNSATDEAKPGSKAGS